MFLPGIIATYIVDMLTSHRKRQPFNFIIHSYLFGVLSYGTMIFIVFINNLIVETKKEIPTWDVLFLKALLDQEEKIVVNEVFIASFIGFVLAVIVSFIINRKFIYRIGNYFKITEKHGDNDVWDQLLGSKGIQWIILRDQEKNKSYQGAVKAYSDKDDKRELLLTDVKVFVDTGGTELEEIYEMAYIYLDLDVNSNIIIEVDGREVQENGE